MKQLTYKINEQKALISAMLKANPEQTKEYITKVITEVFNNSWEDYTINIIIKDGLYYNEFINNRTGEKLYNHCELPITIRNIYNNLFSKLYWQYCN